MSVSLQDQYDKIYKYCYFKVKDKYIAEDITQETFLKYFSQNTYINKGKLLAYLYTIARNKCIDYYRKNQTCELSENIKADDDVEVSLTNISIKQAINTLPEDLAEIILLRYANDLAINEIALMLGISRFKVSRKISKAVKELKLVLREEDFYE